MRKIFDLENPLWQMMSLLSDMMILTMVWFIFCLPVVTIGPATTALFQVGRNLNEKSGKGVIKEFSMIFQKKFRTTFLFGNILTFLSVVLAVDLWYFHSIDQPAATFIFFIFIFLSIIFMLLLIYSYPLLALFNWKIKRTVKTAFFLAVKNFKWSLFLLTIDGFLGFLTLYIAPYSAFFVIGGIAYLNMKVILMILSDTPLLNDRLLKTS